MIVSDYTIADVQSVCVFLFMLWNRRALPKWEVAFATMLKFQEVANS